MGIEVFVLIILILANGVFSMSEIAVFSSRKSRLESMAKKGDPLAKLVLKLSSQPTKFLSTIQIGITTISIMAGVYGGAQFTDNLEAWLNTIPGIGESVHVIALSLVFVSITSLTLILGELVPKKLALNNPEFFARMIARPITIVASIARPLVWVLSVITELILKPFNLKNQEESGAVTEDEIKNLIDVGTAAGEFEEAEQEIIERVFTLGDRKVGSLMTHRIDTEWLDINEPFEDLRKQVLATSHSHLPVCNEDLDKVVGILPTRRFLVNLLERNYFDINELLEKSVFVPENLTAFALLEKFKEAPVRMAMVIDEFGSVQGVVTMTDLTGAIVGHSDEEVESGESPIVERQDGSYLIDALLSFEEFLDYFEIADDAIEDKSGFHTLGGFILQLAEQIPGTGEIYYWKNFSFEIVDMDGNRIDKLLVTLKEEAESVD